MLLADFGSSNGREGWVSGGWLWPCFDVDVGFLRGERDVMCRQVFPPGTRVRSMISLYHEDGTGQFGD